MKNFKALMIEILLSIAGGIIVVIIVDVARAAIRKIKRGGEISDLRRSFKQIKVRIKPVPGDSGKLFGNNEWFERFQSELQGVIVEVTHSENLRTDQHRKLVRMIDKRLYVLENFPYDRPPAEVYGQFFADLKGLRWLGLE